MRKERQDLRSILIPLLNQVAKEWADKFGYHPVSEIDKISESHPLNIHLNDKSLACDRHRQIGIEKKSDAGYIEVRQRFGSPRIGIYAPNREWFVALEYRKDGEIAESQIFKEKGFDMVNVIREEIQKKWDEIADEIKVEAGIISSNKDYHDKHGGMVKQETPRCPNCKKLMGVVGGMISLIDHTTKEGTKRYKCFDCGIVNQELDKDRSLIFDEITGHEINKR